MTQKEWKEFAHLFAYVILLNLTVFIAAVALHEAGHLVLGGMMGCSEGRIVLFDSGKQGPYTEMYCPQETYMAYLGLSGFPFILAFGMAFLLLNVPEKSLGLVVIGMSFLLSGIDMLLVVNASLLTQLLPVAGVALISVGEMRVLDAHITTAGMGSGMKKILR